MKTIIQLLFFIIFSASAFGQKINTIDCKITYLPSIKDDNHLTKISKHQAKKIDSLIDLKKIKIEFSQNDILMINELYSKKIFNGTKMYKITDSTYSKIINDKELELNFEKIKSIQTKSIVDIISNVIDGAPFILTAKTSKNKFIFNNNFSGKPKLKELREYLIFYSIYQEIKFCNPSSKIVEEYFSRKMFLKTLMHYLDRMESENK